MIRNPVAFMSVVFSLFVCAPLARAEGEEISMHASWYGDHWSDRVRPMANGQRFNLNNKTIAAHKTLPMGTRLIVSYKGKTLEMRVQDRGPYIPGRQLDISAAAAEYLGFKKQGTAVVMVKVLGK